MKYLYSCRKQYHKINAFKLKISYHFLWSTIIKISYPGFIDQKVIQEVFSLTQQDLRKIEKASNENILPLITQLHPDNSDLTLNDPEITLNNTTASSLFM